MGNKLELIIEDLYLVILDRDWLQAILLRPWDCSQADPSHCRPVFKAYQEPTFMPYESLAKRKKDLIRLPPPLQLFSLSEKIIYL